MKRKQIFALTMAAAMVCSVPAFAAEAEPVEKTRAEAADDAAQENPTETPQQLPERFLAYGTVVQVNEADGKVVSYLVKNMEEAETIYHVDENTLYLDSGEALPTTNGEIKEGTRLYVYHGPAMALSLPPQTYAEAVVLNTPEDASCAHLHTAEKITKTETGVSILTDQGSLVLHLSADTQVSPWLTKNIVTAADIQEGDRFFAWYEAVEESDPAQANPSRVLLTPAKEAEEEVTDGTSIPVTAGGKTLDVTAKMENGVALIPVRAVAEALGCTVTWNEADKSVTLNNGTRQMTLVLGEDLYVSEAAPETGLIGMTAPSNLGAAPVLDASGTTWAPAELFTVLVGYEVTLQNGVLSIMEI